MILHGADAGEGPPIVLLHGLFGRSQNLGMLARRLAAHYRVVSLDLRNHGGSPHVAGMRYADMAEDVRETLIASGAWPARILGHSMGGKVAMMLALQRPEEVRALVVADIAPVPYHHQNRLVAAALQAIDPAPGLTRAIADAALAPAVAEASVRGFLLQNLVFSEAPYWRIGLSHIADALEDIEGWPEIADTSTYAGPVTFISGANSNFVVQEQRALIIARFPRAMFITIENAGHWLHAEQPEAFGAAAETALRDV